MHRLGHGRLDLLLCFCSNHKIKRKHAAARQWKMPHSRSRQVVLGRWWAKMRTCIACRHGCHKSCFIAFRLLDTRGLPPIILTTQTLHVTPDYISHVPFHWLRFSPSANYTHTIKISLKPPFNTWWVLFAFISLLAIASLRSQFSILLSSSNFLALV